MNRLIIISTIFISFLLPQILLSQDVILSSQADVDAFDPATTVINGNITITGLVNNLFNLSNLTTINGNLTINYAYLLTNVNHFSNISIIKGNFNLRYNNSLLNINGLSSLKSIGGDCIINDNYNLQYIDGLSGITSIGGDFSVKVNDNLKYIDGLSGITSIGGDFSVNDNYNLQYIDGLSGITSIGGDFSVKVNDNLKYIDGLSGITSIGNWMEVAYNDVLTKISGFNGLASIRGISINSNNSLTQLDGFASLTSIENLYIDSNISLQIIDGFTSITFIEYLNISHNVALISLNGFSALQKIQKLVIEENSSITNINTFKGINSIERSLYIQNNEKLTNIDGLLNLKSVTQDLYIVGNSSLTNLDGLSGLTTGGKIIYIAYNESLTNIDGLSSLTLIAGGLNIKGNPKLTNVDGLSQLTFLESLSIIENGGLTNIDGLSGLGPNIFNLEIVDNDVLSDVDGMSGLRSIGYGLYISNNDELRSLDGLRFISSCIRLIIANNKVLSNIDGLSSLNCWLIDLYISNNSSLTNIDGLSGLISVGTVGRFGSLTIINNSSLTNLDGLEDLKLYGSLTIEDNANLKDCCGIQHLIFQFPPDAITLSIKNNSSECSTAEEIKTSRCYDHDYVEGKVNYDGDSDGCDSTDVSIPNIKIRVLQNSNNDFVISDGSGNYRYFIREAGEIVLLPEYDNKLFKIEPDTVIINYPSDSLDLVHDFCVTPVKKFNDLEITVIPLTRARAGFEAAYEIGYKNKGTTIMSDKIELYYYDNLVSFIKADPPADSIYKNTIRWQYNDLIPFEHRKIVVKFKLNKPTDNPPLNGGELLTYAAKIYPVEEYNLQVDNSFRLNQIVVNSLDPNDKTCLDGNEFDIQNVGDYVNYLIRFENKGTAEAVNIKVVDVIDTSLFDISTLEITSSSHSCFTNIYKDTVEFLFEHIFLDFHDDKNDGFIAFKIRTWPTLESGTILKNMANIYFDYNLPVKTNIATTIVKEIVATKETDTGSWQIFPNPSAGSFYIGTDLPGNYSVTLYDTYGKAVYNSTKEIRNLTELQFYNLPSGLYFLKFEDKGKLYYTEKIQIFK